MPPSGVRRELQSRVDQFVRGGFRRHGLPCQQAYDDVEVGLEELAGIGRGQADHRGIAGQRARSHPADDAAVGEVIEQHQAVGNPERVVVRERDDPGAEADSLRPFGGCGDEDLG